MEKTQGRTICTARYVDGLRMGLESLGGMMGAAMARTLGIKRLKEMGSIFGLMACRNNMMHGRGIFKLHDGRIYD